MARYLNDQNKVVFFHESGTYGNASGAGIWAGQVMSNDITDSENKIMSRFLGAATRSFSTMEQGPRDSTGTLTYHPQNMMIPFIAIGSVTESESLGITTHNAVEVNTDVQPSAFTSGTLCPPRSFTLEDSKQAPGTGKNFIRTIVGCVPNTTTINMNQGEKVSVDCEYVGETLSFSSGATTSITEDTTTPYLWSSVNITASGQTLQTVKSASLAIAQNITGPHYLNGSRDISVPYPGNRDNTLTLDIDLDSEDGTYLYNIYKNNEIFPFQVDLNQDSTGSQHAIFTGSNARITEMPNPSEAEGLTESTVTIMAENLSAQEWTSSSTAANFNPW